MQIAAHRRLLANGVSYSVPLRISPPRSPPRMNVFLNLQPLTYLSTSAMRIARSGAGHQILRPRQDPLRMFERSSG
jgi:hypothetical protein